MTGVGAQNSLRLTLGLQLAGQAVKYRVFISEAGTTTSKVFFDVDPAYPGQHTFFLHGIHYVKVGKHYHSSAQLNTIQNGAQKSYEERSNKRLLVTATIISLPMHGTDAS